MFSCCTALVHIEISFNCKLRYPAPTALSSLYPQSLIATPTCSSDSGTILFETCIADQRKINVTRPALPPPPP